MDATALARHVRVGNTLALMAIATLSGACVLGTRSASCTTGPAMPFFILDSRGLRRPTGHVAAPEPSSAGRRRPKSRGTWQRRSPPQRGGWVWSHGQVVVSEPSSTGRRGTEPWDTWQHRSPQWGGEVRSHKTRDSAWKHALLLVLT
jgi:hypothetical protein